MRDVAETKSLEPSIFAGRWLTLRQNGSGVSAAESEETKKMDFPTPPHTPLAGPNQGTKRPHTHKLKLALGYSHDIKAIQAKSSTFNKIKLPFPLAGSDI